MLIIISLPDQATFSATETQASFTLVDAQGQVLRTGRDVLGAVLNAVLNVVPRTSSAMQIIATVPASRIVFIETPLPRISGARREALLRYAIEDKLTIDPDTIHVALLGEAQSDAQPPALLKSNPPAARYIVAAIDRRWFGAALAWLSAAQLSPRAVFAETELVDAAADEWAIVLGPHQRYAKRHDGFAYSLDSGGQALSEPPFALSLALREVAKPPTMLTIYHDEASGATHAELAEWAALATHWQHKLGIPTRLAGLITAAQSGHRLLQLKTGNLLTSEFKPRSAGAGWIQSLRPVMWLVAGLFGLQLIFSAAEAWQLDRQRRNIELDMRQLFQATFPKATAIVDPPLQLQRNLDTLKRERGLSPGGDPRLALAQLTELTQSTELTQNTPELIISEINISENSTVLSGKVSSLEAQNQLRQKIALMPNASLKIDAPKDGKAGNPALVVITIVPGASVKAGT